MTKITSESTNSFSELPTVMSLNGNWGTEQLTVGAFFWGYSGYSYSGLGIKEHTEFQFLKERSYIFQIWKRNWR